MTYVTSNILFIIIQQRLHNIAISRPESNSNHNYSFFFRPLIHREKRKFLRTALRELALVFTDQPGLLGPKALYVFMALSLARDEFNWLLRHYDNPPPRKANVKWHHEEFVDRQIPELLFHVEELRGMKFLDREPSDAFSRFLRGKN